MTTTKNNRIAFYVGEAFVVLFLLTMIMLLTTFFKKSYSEPESSAYPTKPFTVSYDPNTSRTANYISDAFAHCTGENCNPLINGSATAVDSFKIPLNYSISGDSRAIYTLQKNLSIPGSTETIGDDANNPVAIDLDGIEYIINHGYYDSNNPGDFFNKSNYGSMNNNIKQYLTQMALWLLIYEDTDHYGALCSSTIDANVTGCNFNFKQVSGETTTYTPISATNVRTIIDKAAAENGYQYLGLITDFVDAAKQFNGKYVYNVDTEQEANYTVENNLVLTNLITPISKGEKMINYDLSIEDPNHYGAYLIDSSGTKITTLTNRTGAFRIAIPVSNYGEGMDLTSVRVRISGKFITYFPYNYHITDTPNQSLIDAGTMNRYSFLVAPVTNKNSSTREIFPFNYILLSKVDVASGKDIPNVELTVIDKVTNNAVATITTSNKPTMVMIANGDYKLCESSSSSEYSSTKQCSDFTVDGKKIIRVKLESAKVPNTAAGAYKGFYYIGSLLLLVGIGVVTTLLFKEKHKVKTTE